MTTEEKAKAYDDAIKRGLDYIRQTPATEMVTRQDVFEAIFPEYAENEDEKIRKNLIELLLDTPAQDIISHHLELSKILDWFEKQKEEEGYEAIPVESTLEYKLGFKAGKESEKQKEQKPVKLNDNTEVGLNRALQIVKAAKGNLCGYQSDDGIYECCHAIQTLERILKNGIEQRPVEWSEEEEDKLEQCIRIVRGWEGDYDIVKSPYSNFLKSLRPQPKQEWSEEDDNIYNKALDAIYYKDINDKDEVVDALKALCDLISRKRKVIPPYARWKPSEEQMKALKEVAYNIVGTGTETDVHLVQLYEQLKRL